MVQVAKNLVLAGAGLVAIADDTPCSSRSFGNFLVPASCPPDSSVAEASASTLKDMNPLIKVVVQPGSATALTAEQIKDYDIVVASGLSFMQLQALEAISMSECLP
jgi:molybdopterin/thiamine biosynthesis adenylyltransferase